MDLFWEILLIIAAYLSGSIPFGVILTKKYTGKDIHKHGSGNIGSTNVKRLAGKKVSVQTQLLDMAKGLVPVGITLLLIQLEYISPVPYLIYLVAFSAILGHDFSIFLKFKGGKGINTMLGASILMAPIPVLSGVASYYLVKWATKYVSVASISLVTVIVVVDALLKGITFEFWYFLAAGILSIILHIPNLKRLMQGTEEKVNSGTSQKNPRQ